MWPDFNVFFAITRLTLLQCIGIWYLTQCVRWGKLSEPEIRRVVYEDGERGLSSDFMLKRLNVKIFGKRKMVLMTASSFLTLIKRWILKHHKASFRWCYYDGKHPNDYLKSFKIGFERRRSI